jgi:hypothetical protein
MQLRGSGRKPTSPLPGEQQGDILSASRQFSWTNHDKCLEIKKLNQIVSAQTTDRKRRPTRECRSADPTNTATARVHDGPLPAGKRVGRSLVLRQIDVLRGLVAQNHHCDGHVPANSQRSSRLIGIVHRDARVTSLKARAAGTIMHDSLVGGDSIPICPRAPDRQPSRFALHCSCSQSKASQIAHERV